MTDLEMTHLCAEAMDLSVDEATTRTIGYREEGWIWIRHEADHIGYRYGPLHDDAQAMAIQKKFGLEIRTEWHNPGKSTAKLKAWIAYSVDEWASDASLNRAIVECVAKMQEAKNV